MTVKIPRWWYFRMTLGVMRSSKVKLSSFSACWRQDFLNGQIGQWSFSRTGGGSDGRLVCHAFRVSIVGVRFAMSFDK